MDILGCFFAAKKITRYIVLFSFNLIQAEIFVQCLANMGLLSVPLMLQSSGYLTGPLTPLETLSWGLWAISLGWEHLADSQKINFSRFPKQALQRGLGICPVCNAMQCTLYLWW